MVCEKCKGVVRKRNARAALGRLQFHFANPENACTLALASPTGVTTAFGGLPPEKQLALRQAHDAEVRERLQWCLKNELTPAHDHVHRAPGCDANFMVRMRGRGVRQGRARLQDAC